MDPRIVRLNQLRSTQGRVLTRETPAINVVNNSGTELTYGDIVVVDPTAEKSVRTTLMAGAPNPMVVLSTGDHGQTVKCIAPFAGVAIVTCNGAAITPGDSIITSTVAKEGKVLEAEAAAGVVGIALTSKGLGTTEEISILVGGNSFGSSTWVGPITIVDGVGDIITILEAGPTGCLRVPCIYTPSVVFSLDYLTETDNPVEIGLTEYLGTRESFFLTKGDSAFPVPSSVWYVQHDDGDVLRAQLYKYPGVYPDIYFNIVHDDGVNEENWFEANYYETVFNDSGLDRDLRVEGITDPYLLFVDALNEFVGIRTGLPEAPLTVDGNIQLGILDDTRYIYFDDGTGSNPGIRYDSVTDKMQFSHDGIAWTDMGVDGIGLPLDHNDPLEIGNVGPADHHNPITLGGGSDPALALVGQQLTLADVLTPAEHTAIGDGAPHHAAVTLHADLNANLLELTGQLLDLDVQNENLIFSGPAAAPAAKPTFRALVAADFPLIGNIWTRDAVGGEIFPTNLADIVGIRIASPDGTLHVHSASAGAVAAHADFDDLIVENNGPTGMSFLSPTDEQAGFAFGDPDDNDRATFVYYHTSDSFFWGIGGEALLSASVNLLKLWAPHAAAAEAQIEIEQKYTEDASILFDIDQIVDAPNVTQDWIIGVDYDDDVRFKISASNALGTRDALMIDPDNLAMYYGAYGDVSGLVASATSTTTTLYVDGGAGSDVTGTGTKANPYATIEHALLELPDLFLHTCTIYVRTGSSYTGSLDLKGTNLGLAELTIQSYDWTADVAIDLTEQVVTAAGNHAAGPYIGQGWVELASDHGLTDDVLDSGKLWVYKGTGAGHIYDIDHNDVNAAVTRITVVGAWTVIPDATSRIGACPNCKIVGDNTVSACLILSRSLTVQIIAMWLVPHTAEIWAFFIDRFGIGSLRGSYLELYDAVSGLNAVGVRMSGSPGASLSIIGCCFYIGTSIGLRFQGYSLLKANLFYGAVTGFGYGVFVWYGAWLFCYTQVADLNYFKNLAYGIWVWNNTWTSGVTSQTYSGCTIDHIYWACDTGPIIARDGVSDFSDGSLRVKIVTDNVASPPTDAQLDTAFGTPAALGESFVGIIDDNNAHVDVWLCVTAGGAWWYEQLTKAL